MKSPKFRLLAIAAISAFALAGCATSGDTAPTDAASTEAAAAAGTVTIEDNTGTHEIQTPVETVVALDNRTFETLSDWGIELAAAPVDLMPETIPYASDESIVNIGNHREPNLELIVAAQPDVIISGQRFSQYDEEIAKLVPDAVIINLDPRDGEDFGAELERQTLALGELFGKQTEAEQLVTDFQTARDRVTAAYNPEQTVMSVIVSGGEIGYSAPGEGRTFGPLYNIFNFTPSLEVDDASTDHQGDDISVEAIADSNPDWILVMDRDAGTSSSEEEGYQPAEEIIAGAEALQNVTAVQEGNIYYVPADTYTNESIQTYTEIYNGMADAFEGAN
ncbi:siderophore ABC transporter substrate-binding protein [Gulosibacter chungangensis]|uniref:ABC transporter substrate-binding protein n=1 Tax=Gulosibacter chungangensis TaxID=979746 RepID=A0A7J5BD75_9MICO|nr:ABC transporter substrate-binding protein [Gulosibacter chungangensis]KAB1644099.1 ABC transporter substrate-binding protein [Gulosibacter chungangensis]